VGCLSCPGQAGQAACFRFALSFLNTKAHALLEKVKVIQRHRSQSSSSAVQALVRCGASYLQFTRRGLPCHEISVDFSYEKGPSASHRFSASCAAGLQQKS
jgi:hypothetical protein